MSDRRFMTSFILLALVSGMTVGLGKIVTTLFALQLGASPFQIGIISAMESAGMILVTVPAGFIIARYGARPIYFAASLGPLLVNLALPFAAGWAALAAGRWLVGLCIPFRMISMNSSFLERLRAGGDSRGGWYRGSLTAGVSIVGPAVAAALTLHAGITAGFLLVALLFGLMAVFSLSFMPQREAPESGADQSISAQILQLVRDPVASETCMVEFLGSATTSLFGTFIILLALALPPLGEQDGIRVLLVQGAAATTMLFVGGHLVAGIARPAAYAIGLGFAAASMLSLALASSFLGLAAAAVFLSVGAALVHLVNVRMLAALPGAKSKVAGLYNLATMGGSTAGALLGGLLSRLLPLQSVFLAWLPVLFGGAALIALAHRVRTPSLTASEALR